MFRKTWKTLKFFIILAIILICLPTSILPHSDSKSQQEDYDYYLKQNDSELRLPEYKDTPDALKLKLIQLNIINVSRRKFNAPPVKLDILASRVANKMCTDAARNNFVGHWNLAGEKPYHRYGFAGGYDHVSENAFGEWSSDNYQVSDNKITSLMKTGHATFMSERAPNDGHKKTIIEKPHNFVGIGYYLDGKQFRYYEEFIDRYFEFENIPGEAKSGEPLNITLKTDGKSYLYFLVVTRDDFPKEMTAMQIKKRGYYTDYGDEEYKTLTAWELARYRNDSTYRIPLVFNKEGLYYIQIYSDKKEITKPTSINSKGRTPYSGIVIKVSK